MALFSSANSFTCMHSYNTSVFAIMGFGHRRHWNSRMFAIQQIPTTISWRCFTHIITRAHTLLDETSALTVYETRTGIAACADARVRHHTHVHIHAHSFSKLRTRTCTYLLIYQQSWMHPDRDFLSLPIRSRPIRQPAWPHAGNRALCTRDRNRLCSPPAPDLEHRRR